MVLWASCGLGQESGSDVFGQAEQLYRSNCAACHDNGAGGAPTRAAIGQLTPARIRAALETGVMKPQGDALTPTERGLLAEHLGAKLRVDATAQTKACTGRLELSEAPLWNRWGNSLHNDRYQEVAQGGIAPEQANSLELKWAFAFPDAARARSQPAVTREAIFTGSQSGRVYALGVEDGCVWWTFDADSEVRSAPTLGQDASGRIDRLYFGDFNANVYAVDARSGRLIWKRKVQDHPAGTITGSPTLHKGRLYVPMSSTEVVSAYSPDYECCTFRGGVVALDAADGRPLWRSYTVPPPKRTGENPKGVPSWGPSGAPVWSSPTVDAKRGLIYVGTGENYSSPATDMSDAIVAFDMTSGRTRWVRQTVRGDAWNAACGPKNNRVNCPEEDGPDFDFGAPPILVKLANGRDLLLAGQKSGMIYALDPAAKGRIVWQQRAGMGGFNGGVHWGMATDGRTLYVGIADTPGHLTPTGPPRQGLHAFDVLTGKPLWSRIEPLVCAENKHECRTALSAAITLTDGIVFAGALNGKLMAYSTADGRTLWSVDTHRAFPTINGVKGMGGAIDSAGPVVAGGLLIVNSGYDKFGQIPGNVLLVFGHKERKRP
ncbi:PQQ-binding-like beta-propeller repeat protein [Sphingomonas sp.]|jgi:polyvinyl alcohol dehydrogenase (cytochrome)|uniref:outer membrane protein assembly factor BamB family protein n=1 Tax=Sphingomonas sp. TaxID=28214 RepID=UPI002DF6A315|nr:PQQ-binding-like beta-propeller repeat protein [Sphingomonas sp.]